MRPTLFRLLALCFGTAGGACVLLGVEPIRCSDDGDCPTTQRCGAGGTCALLERPGEGEGEGEGEGGGEGEGEGEGESNLDVCADVVADFEDGLINTDLWPEAELANTAERRLELTVSATAPHGFVATAPTPLSDVMLTARLAVPPSIDGHVAYFMLESAGGVKPLVQRTVSIYVGTFNVYEGGAPVYGKDQAGVPRVVRALLSSEELVFEVAVEDDVTFDEVYRAPVPAELEVDGYRWILAADSTIGTEGFIAWDDTAFADDDCLPCAPTFADHFDVDEIARFWPSPPSNTNDGSVVVADGSLTLTLAAGPAGSRGIFLLTETGDRRNVDAGIRILAEPAPGLALYYGFDRVSFDINAGIIRCVLDTDNVIGFVEYDATAMSFLRVSTSGSSASFQVSSDGFTFSEICAAPSVDVADAFVQLGLYNVDDEALAVPLSAVVDNVVVAPNTCP